MPFNVPATGKETYSKDEIDRLFKGGIGGGSTAPGKTISVIVPSWTAGIFPDTPTPFYYDLAHYRNRKAVVIQLHQAGVGLIPYIGTEETTTDPANPALTDPLNIIRIWLSFDPGANNIEIGYL